MVKNHEISERKSEFFELFSEVFYKSIFFSGLRMKNIFVFPGEILLIHHHGACCGFQDFFVGGYSPANFVHTAKKQRGHTFSAGLGINFVSVPSGNCHVPDIFRQQEQFGYSGSALVAGEATFGAAPAMIDYRQFIQ